MCVIEFYFQIIENLGIIFACNSISQKKCEVCYLLQSVMLLTMHPLLFSQDIEFFTESDFCRDWKGIIKDKTCVWPGFDSRDSVNGPVSTGRDPWPQSQEQALNTAGCGPTDKIIAPKSKPFLQLYLEHSSLMIWSPQSCLAFS